MCQINSWVRRLLMLVIHKRKTVRGIWAMCFCDDENTWLEPSVVVVSNKATGLASRLCLCPCPLVLIANFDKISSSQTGFRSVTMFYPSFTYQDAAVWVSTKCCWCRQIVRAKTVFGFSVSYDITWIRIPVCVNLVCNWLFYECLFHLEISPLK